MQQHVKDSILQSLPQAIWVPGGGGEVSVYRGSPIEMVYMMAQEMGLGTPREAVVQILHGLAENRGIAIGLPGNASDEKLSALFVFALLDTRLAKVVPSS